MKRAFVAAGFALGLIGASLALAQSSPLYQVTNSGTVAVSGSSASPRFAATVVGGEGASSAATSSPTYSVTVGAGNNTPVNAQRIFANGFD